jgi:hypothetical protein
MPFHVECKCEEFYGGKQNGLITSPQDFHIFSGNYKRLYIKLDSGNLFQNVLMNL